MSESDSAAQSVFRNRTLPQLATLAGYAYLVDKFSLQTILPYQMHAVSTTQSDIRTLDWIIHPLRRKPQTSDVAHLLFALKHEGVNLLLLKQIFAQIGPAPLENAVHAKPTSAYLHRLCFFYDWLMDDKLTAPSDLAGAYADAIDTKLQYATERSEKSQKWRIRDNLPGTAAFCPLIARTQKLDRYLAANLPGKATDAIKNVPPELLARASSFLLLNDSKASFEIEKEKPSKDRAARWAAVIGRAGETHLSQQLLIDLQESLIEDDRFVELGIRTEGGFVGVHTALGDPRPDHINARAKDLNDLLNGVIEAEAICDNYNYDTVLTAATIAFGFVYIHPFEDGNGRLHRYLIHHVLSEREYFSHSMTLPISVAILADLMRYRQALEALSKPLLTVVDWQPTDKGNVKVRNETADYYRYFDATPHAEFLFDCIERTIEIELPDELRFLSARDDFHRAVTDLIDMPEKTLDILFRMLRQNEGQFSQRMLKREFERLLESEVHEIEQIYSAITN